MTRHNQSLESVATARGCCWLLALVICQNGVCRDAVAQRPQMVRWEILATVVDIVDPLGLFPDVRLGDPVRGMLKYDLTLYPNPLFSTTYDTVFTNELWIDVSRMTIENPRNGTEFTFQKDVENGIMYVDVFNDFPVDDVLFDGLYCPQPVVPPQGYMGTSPVVAVVLEGPSTVFRDPPQFPTIDAAPPATLELDDWPAAALVFWDADFEDPSATSIEAEIYSLTPVIGPPLPGDYDYDGDVDDDDYYGWKVLFGDDILLYSDGNSDGVVDAADYVVWRDNVGAGGSSALSNTGEPPAPTSAVPEPSTLLLAALALVPLAWRIRGARKRGPRHVEYLRRGR